MNMSCEGDSFVPYVSLDPLNDPKSCTYKLKVSLLNFA